MQPGDEVVKRGVWLYDDTVPTAIRITRSNMFYGTGDYEDPPEIGEDREVETFTIWFETSPGRFNAGSGQYFSLAEAIADTEERLPSAVKWE